jgi:hypothetical protein
MARDGSTAHTKPGFMGVPQYARLMKLHATDHHNLIDNFNKVFL